MTSNQRHTGLLYFISVVPDTEVTDMQFFCQSNDEIIFPAQSILNIYKMSKAKKGNFNSLYIIYFEIFHHRSNHSSIIYPEWHWKGSIVNSGQSIWCRKMSDQCVFPLFLGLKSFLLEFRQRAEVPCSWLDTVVQLFAEHWH